MSISHMAVWGGLAVLAAVSAGCGGAAALSRQADAACEAIAIGAADTPAAEAPVSEPGCAGATPRLARTGRFPLEQTLYLAPREAGEAEGAAAADAETGKPAEPADEPFASIKGRTMGQVILDDLRGLPRSVGRGVKHTYAKPENLIILATAFGADRIIRHNLDGDIRDDLRHNDTSLAETGDFGTIIGNPALHFGVAGAWYLTSLHKQDQGHYEKSRTMIQALMVNGISTMLLKWSMDDETPNDEEWGWPSGHTSSSMCFAAVMHEYYGWKAGAPLYLLAGYQAATRLEDREHDLSDVIFGAALGLVVGHSVVQGELPQVAGFHVLPYGERDAGGLMFVKRW